MTPGETELVQTSFRTTGAYTTLASVMTSAAAEAAPCPPPARRGILARLFG